MNVIECWLRADNDEIKLELVKRRKGLGREKFQGSDQLGLSRKFLFCKEAGCLNDATSEHELCRVKRRQVMLIVCSAMKGSVSISESAGHRSTPPS